MKTDINKVVGRKDYKITYAQIRGTIQLLIIRNFCGK